MNFIEINKKAKEAALRSLEKGFDWQAFLVLSHALENEERLGQPMDVVPESRVDEGIQYLLKLFADYINAKKSGKTKDEKAVTSALDKLLSQNVKILKEIRLSCETQGEKEVFYKYLEDLKKLG